MVEVLSVLVGKEGAGFFRILQPSRVNPRAMQVMAELGIDISHHWSKSVYDLAGKHFDLVITVCDQAAEQFPLFPGVFTFD